MNLPQRPPYLNLEEPPRLSAELYERLPELLRTTTLSFEKNYQRAPYLLSSLPVVMTALPNISVLYSDKRYLPSRMSTLIAPPASGKGTIEWSRKLGTKVDASLKSAPLNFGKGANPPEASLHRGLFAPANASASALHLALEANDGRLLIHETEIDGFLQAQGQDWGDFTDVLRKAFEHEPVTMLRNERSLHVEDPCISTVFAGTPDQAQRLFGNNISNGFYSRCKVYYFEGPRAWVSQKPTNKDAERGELFESAASDLLEIHKQLRQRERPLPFTFTEAQWKTHAQVFSTLTEEFISTLNSQPLFPSIKRSGVGVARLAMTFAALRAHEQDGDLHTMDALPCTNADLQTAIGIELVELNHSLIFALDYLSRSTPTSIKEQRMHQLLAALPDAFTRQVAVDIGQSVVGIAPATVGRYLRELVTKGQLDSTGHGTYAKTGGSLLIG